MRRAEQLHPPSTSRNLPSFLWVGDHPALDLLNTQYLVAGKLEDTFDSDQDVVHWLFEAHQPSKDGRSSGSKPGTLLAAARTLRDLVRGALEQRKRGVRVDVQAFNNFLRRGKSCLQLDSQQKGLVSAERWWDTADPVQVLAPLAEAAAELLADPAIELVRQCEAEDCVLWFYDRTKAHRRRWCSAATCGNRHKVAALRQRRRDAKA